MFDLGHQEAMCASVMHVADVHIRKQTHTHKERRLLFYRKTAHVLHKHKQTLTSGCPVRVVVARSSQPPHTGTPTFHRSVLCGTPLAGCSHLY